MSHQSFPKRVYYEDNVAGVLVQSQEELDALNPGWAESPEGPFVEAKPVSKSHEPPTGAHK